MTDVACPKCDGATASGLDGLFCSCGWSEAECACGTRMEFDPNRRGTTCGGLVVVGAAVCPSCGDVEVCHRSRPADGVEWALAKGGRSLTAGGLKLRAEKGDGDDVEALMARILRLPELEIEVARLRQLVARRTA